VLGTQIRRLGIEPAFSELFGISPNFPTYFLSFEIRHNSRFRPINEIPLLWDAQDRLLFLRLAADVLAAPWWRVL